MNDSLLLLFLSESKELGEKAVLPSQSTTLISLRCITLQKPCIPNTHLFVFSSSYTQYRLLMLLNVCREALRLVMEGKRSPWHPLRPHSELYPRALPEVQRPCLQPALCMSASTRRTPLERSPNAWWRSTKGTHTKCLHNDPSLSQSKLLKSSSTVIS